MGGTGLQTIQYYKMIPFHEDLGIRKLLNKITWKQLAIASICFMAGIAWQNMWIWISRCSL